LNGEPTAAHFDSKRRPSTRALMAFVIVTAILYLAREVLIPLAVGALFSFMLAPAVRRLEIWGAPRVPAVLLVTVLGIGIVGGVGWVAGQQFVNLASKLPEYRENIVKKLQTLRAPPSGQLGKATEALKEIEKEASRGQPRTQEPARKLSAIHVPSSAYELIGIFGVPILTLFVAAIAVVVFTIFMLMQRDDLRDRIIRLMGEAQINQTTRAMEDAAKRVSRYLLTMLLVNGAFGVPLAAALYLIGVPNAALWGLLAMVLRFIPYVGAWIAMSMPVVLAFAISEGWELVAWTAGTIIALELVVAYGIEPWLYGQSTGLSPLAVIMAIVFWTWLWGPIGLVVGTPLTVCVAVIGRHVPQFGFLNILLGVEPVLPPEVRLYQRLMSFEAEEALELAQEQADKDGIQSVYAQMVIPALSLVKRDKQADKLSERRERFIYEAMLRMMEELRDKETSDKEPTGSLPEAKRADLCIVPAHDDADHIAGMALARLLVKESLRPELLHASLTGEVVDKVVGKCEHTVCISAVPPNAVAPASYLCKRLRQRFPEMKIVVALWGANGRLERTKQRLTDAGANEVATTLAEALDQVRGLGLPRVAAS
jgi:predicted PurR-regulated permease PerM